MSRSNAVDKQDLLAQLLEGAKCLGMALPDGAAEPLLEYLAELLRWNQKVNLTAIRDPAQALEIHLLDSLAVWPEVRGARTLLDLGAGGGLPGLVLKLLEPSIELVLVDSVAKKVGFLKHAIAALGLKGARAVHARVEGSPDAEGLARAEVVISRAFKDLPDWVALGSKYVAPGGRLIAMMGKAPTDPEAVAQQHGFARVTLRGYALPFSGATRHVAVLNG
jgi:16S rRNA (guanine527-N7)-methyltransferase